MDRAKAPVAAKARAGTQSNQLARQLEEMIFSGQLRMQTQVR